jgi:hypothetical protein
MADALKEGFSMTKGYEEIRTSNGRKLAEHKYDGRIHTIQILAKSVLTTILLYPDGEVKIDEETQHPQG